MYPYDMAFMEQALLLAREAKERGDVPIGALVVSPYGEVLGTGFNQVEIMQSQDFHAELIALRAATKARNDWRLDGCTLYVTLEPCIMCFGAILLSRIERLVYACSSPIYGYTNALIVEPEVAYGGFLKNTTRGVLSDQSELLLKGFFTRTRLK